MYDIHDDHKARLHHYHSKIKGESLLSALMGFLVSFIPMTIGYGFLPYEVNIISWNFTLTGISIVFLSIITIRYIQSWCAWLMLAGGAWLMLSPWLLGYTNNTILLLSSIIFGFIIASCAASLIPKAQRPFYGIFHKESSL